MIGQGHLSGDAHVEFSIDRWTGVSRIVMPLLPARVQARLAAKSYFKCVPTAVALVVVLPSKRIFEVHRDGAVIERRRGEAVGPSASAMTRAPDVKE